jgi:glyoxylase-like metal-dependent hydrolase (beta-lactamase superfamily II)
MPVERWTVGDVSITKVIEAEIWLPLDYLDAMLPKSSRVEIDTMQWLQPNYVLDGNFSIGYYSFLIETPDRTLVVDTGIGNSKSRTLPHHNMLDTAYLDNLRQVCRPTDIDGVICTHLHVDHVGWNTRLVDGDWVPTFGNANYYFVESEYEHWKSYASNDRNALGYTVIDGRGAFEDSVLPIVEAGLVIFIRPDETITGEVSVIPSHGHTPGHVSVLVESRGESAVITGDLMHNPCQLGRPDWSATYDVDQEAAETTRRAFLERFADTGTLVIGTHFGTPTGVYVEREGTSFRLAPAG